MRLRVLTPGVFLLMIPQAPLSSPTGSILPVLVVLPPNTLRVERAAHGEVTLIMEALATGEVCFRKSQPTGNLSFDAIFRHSPDCRELLIRTEMKIGSTLRVGLPLQNLPEGTASTTSGLIRFRATVDHPLSPLEDPPWVIIQVSLANSGEAATVEDILPSHH